MGQDAVAPVGARERLFELDVIRGFALFGVLWMNLFEHAELAMPPGMIDALPTARIDEVVRFFTVWLAAGKAQALFSFLFGLGFALFLERAEASGSDGMRLYLRRLTVLLLIGVAHMFLLWVGDILNSYALMGFALVLTRRWPGWLLLLLGIALTFSTLWLRLLSDFWLVPPGQQPWWAALSEQGAIERYPVFMGHDYIAYVRALARSWWVEIYSNPIGVIYLAWILGRFMIGSWIYRQGWMQDTARHAAGFKRWAAILLPLGLALALVGPMLVQLQVRAEAPWSYGLSVLGRSMLIILPLGYAAAIVVLCQRDVWRNRFDGLAAVGRMALTNYLTQSLVFFFVLYGFGLGLLPYAGATFCLGLAVIVFGAQIVFSRWWLARYRFGPAEWLWRSLTYGRRQPMRRVVGQSIAAA